MIEIEKAEQLGAWAYQIAGLEYKVLRLYVPEINGYVWFDGYKRDWVGIDDEDRTEELEKAHSAHQAQRAPTNYG